MTRCYENVCVFGHGFELAPMTQQCVLAECVHLPCEDVKKTSSIIKKEVLTRSELLA